MTLALLLLLLALPWALSAARGLRDLRAVPPLPPLPEPPPEAKGAAPSPPSVTAVIPARDGAVRLEQTLRRLLAQRGVDMRVVAVDDRSSDATPAVLARLAAEDARVTAVRVDRLPAAWLGKCHALALGAAAASGDWLLFCDADVWLEPDAVARAVRAAERTGAHHACLLPSVGGRTVWGRAALIDFVRILVEAMAGANRDDPRRHIGLGAFNLIRRDAYQRIGGHQPLRLEILDDVRLGLLVQRAGLKTRGWLAADAVHADYAPTARDVLRVLEKNMFAAVGLSTPLALLAAGTFLTLWAGGLLGAVAGVAADAVPARVAGWILAASFWANAIPAARIARVLRWPAANALLAPLSFVVLAVALLRSMRTTLRQRGVRWRDTWYPLAMLRRGRVVA